MDESAGAPPSSVAVTERDGGGADHARLTEVMEVILGIAANDFSRRASVGDGDDLLDGIATGLNMLAEEVGRQRAAEEGYRERLLRSERLAAIGQLAAGVAHEINNPAAFLLANFSALSDRLVALRAWMASLAGGAALPPIPGRSPGAAPVDPLALVDELAEIGRVGESGVERIVSIVRGLRGFARADAEQVQPVRLDQVAEEACALVEREIRFRAALHKRLLPTPAVMGERTRLVQVVTNLLVNAAQSIPEGNPGGNLVEVGTFSERDRVVVTVRDTGAGIEPELQRRIFQPFFTTKGREQGTGLGLSISADIVHHHRGEIRVTSAPGAGSTFEVWLPIAAVDRPGLAAGAAAQTPAAAPAAAAGPSPGATPAARARVLVIDDEEQLLMAYRRMLVNRFDVTVARGGREGLDVLARDTAWDAILCDVLMPGVDGPAIWEWLQQNQPALLSRVLFCSGGAFTPRSEAFAEVMTDRILDKPLSRSRLEEAIAARLAANAP